MEYTRYYITIREFRVWCTNNSIWNGRNQIQKPKPTSKHGMWYTIIYGKYTKCHFSLLYILQTKSSESDMLIIVFGTAEIRYKTKTNIQAWTIMESTLSASVICRYYITIKEFGVWCNNSIWNRYKTKTDIQAWHVVYNYGKCTTSMCHFSLLYILQSKCSESDVLIIVFGTTLKSDIETQKKKMHVHVTLQNMCCVCVFQKLWSR